MKHPMKAPKGLDRLAVPWQRTEEYMRYVMDQASRTQTKRGLIAGTRVMDLIAACGRVDPKPPDGRLVLCVGCRNTHEIAAWFKAGFKDVIGIDLVSFDPCISAMDMHAMRFPDGMFDIVFSCHSLEHAYDVDVALREWARVTKPGGLWAIEVPVRFKTTDIDRHDFDSGQGLWERVKTWAQKDGFPLFVEDRGGKVRMVVEVA